VAPGSCKAATLAELTKVDALGSPEGQACLALAAAIDSGRSLMALPAMVTSLRATLTALRERNPRAKDTTDEFTARRAARREAAGF
jgi:hypothetical protein